MYFPFNLLVGMLYAYCIPTSESLNENPWVLLSTLHRTYHDAPLRPTLVKASWVNVTQARRSSVFPTWAQVSDQAPQVGKRRCIETNFSGTHLPWNSWGLCFQT